MPQEFLRRGKTRQKPDSNFREGASAELGICLRPVWASAYCGKCSERPPWKWWFFRWIFAVGLPGHKIQKIRRIISPENLPADNKRFAGARPPETTSRPKNPVQNLPANPPVKPPSTRRVFFD